MVTSRNRTSASQDNLGLIDVAVLKARELFARVNPPDPPYNPLDFMTVLGIGEIRYAEIEEDALLFLRPDGSFVIKTRRALTPVERRRQRYTLAHEVAHAMLFRVWNVRITNGKAEKDGGQGVPDEIIEKACDAAAAELLMPREEFMRRLDRAGYSVGAILSLSRVFNTSLQATARRFTECAGPKTVVIQWSLIDPGCPEKGFKPDWIAADPRRTRILRPNNVVPPDSQLHRALKTRAAVRGYQRLNLGGDDKDYYMESIALRNRKGAVLSIIPLAPLPRGS